MSSRKKSQFLSMKPYRGTRDFYPEDMRFRRWIFDTMRRAAESFGYEEYDGPMLERFELYAAKSGRELVNEQLYHFEDRAGRHVAMRPEMTPTLARLVAARINQLVRPIRWYSIPNLWRYEKPQRGRLREHWQFNVDIFGIDEMTADLEIIEVAVAIMAALGAQPKDYKIHISNRKLLNDFLERTMGLDRESGTAVCKAIDKRAKVPPETFDEMILSCGVSTGNLDELKRFMELSIDELADHPISDSQGFKELSDLFRALQSAGLAQSCRLDLSIVRGLDYYTGTVFEMYDQHPENNRALFGGGRYDNLVGMFVDKTLSGIGFGMGDVTIADFVKVHGLTPEQRPPVDVFIALFDSEYRDNTLELARFCRKHGFKTTAQLIPAKLKKQFKSANAKQIPVVVIQGPDEIAEDTVTVKRMETGEQIQVSLDELPDLLKKWVNSPRTA